MRRTPEEREWAAAVRQATLEAFQEHGPMTEEEVRSRVGVRGIRAFRALLSSLYVARRIDYDYESNTYRYAPRSLPASDECILRILSDGRVHRSADLAASAGIAVSTCCHRLKLMCDDGRAERVHIGGRNYGYRLLTRATSGPPISHPNSASGAGDHTGLMEVCIETAEGTVWRSGPLDASAADACWRDIRQGIASGTAVHGISAEEVTGVRYAEVGP